LLPSTEVEGPFEAPGRVESSPSLDGIVEYNMRQDLPQVHAHPNGFISIVLEAQQFVLTRQLVTHKLRHKLWRARCKDPFSVAALVISNLGLPDFRNHPQYPRGGEFGGRQLIAKGNTVAAASEIKKIEWGCRWAIKSADIFGHNTQCV
jgi:hypothetical protein